MASRRRQDASGGTGPPHRAPGAPRETATLGASIEIRGQVKGKEDLLIEGTVEGRVELSDGVLTVGEQGTVTAAISARAVTVEGRLEGDVLGTERVEIRSTGRLRGDIVCSSIVIDEGAEIHGSISTQRPSRNCGRGQPGRSLAAKPEAPQHPT